jgi:hypothetical protein
MSNYANGLCPDNSFTNTFTPLSGTGAGGNEFPGGIIIGSPPTTGGAINPVANNATILVRAAALQVGADIAENRIQITPDGVNHITSSQDSYPIILFGTDNANLDFISEVNGYPVITSGNQHALQTAQGQGTADSGGQLVVNLINPFQDTTYSVFGTRIDAAPTNIIWARITNSGTFQINTDANAEICWIAVGRPVQEY